MAGDAFDGVFAGLRVLVTGSSGLVGSWAVRWLAGLGAEVHGLSRGLATPPVPTPPPVYSHACDLTSLTATRDTVARIAPTLILHLAGQALVPEGFARPTATFEANVVGTIAILEAARHCPSTDAVVALGSARPPGQEDGGSLLGPYAQSKVAAEAVVAGYAHPRTRRLIHGRPLRIGLARPGVMIGGDWSAGRLVPDTVRAARAGNRVPLRDPNAVRPWQHVLDGVSGMLTYAWNLLRGFDCRPLYDLGRPAPDSAETAGELCDRLVAGLGLSALPDSADRPDAGPAPPDTILLGCAMATADLGWRPTWTFPEAVAACADWYRRVLADPGSAAAVTDDQISAYQSDAERLGLRWAIAQARSEASR